MARSSSGESMLARVVRIVEVFETGDRALRVAEIARSTGLPMATASRLVEELVGHGWLQRDQDRRVRLGMRLWELAGRASPAIGLREAAVPFLEDLHAVIGHHAQLGVLEGREVLFVERRSAPGSPVNVAEIAGRLPLHASSAGLVLLAHAPAHLQDLVLGSPLRAYTQNTVTDPVRLRALLADVRRRGYALGRGFLDLRSAGLAVPVRNGTDAVVATLSVIVPNDERAAMPIPALRAAARGVRRALSH